jgi:DNA-binding response OmpR family regulator
LKVLIVEDDPQLGDLLADAVRSVGWRPVLRRDGPSGLTEGLTRTCGLILLDIMLPGMEGWEVCRQLRAGGIDVPLLMLTAKDEVSDRVRGLDLGADDYLVKPFELTELLARMRALVRRETHHKSGRMEAGTLVIDSNGSAASIKGLPLPLTPREFSLLEALVRNEGQVLTREAILERVWNAEEALPNTVNFHMASLRKKLDAAGESGLIQTVHGLGYTFRRKGEDG